MKRNKLYFFLMFSLIILIFSVAATCTLCGTNTGQSSSSSAQGETTSSGAGSDQNTSSTAASGESTTSTQGGSSTTQSGGATTTTSSSGKSAPTISLSTYEGPTYSAADNVCYYRIAATVAGNPAPSVSFSRDDSHGAWGTKKVQINLHYGESYTLTATATNSEGSASATINLTYGCAEGSTTTTAANSAPNVSEITISNPNPVTNTNYNLSVDATDPDGDTLTYSWSVTAGTLTSSTTNPTTWKTPGSAGNYTISLSVTDNQGHNVNKTKTVTVVAAPPVAIDLAKVAAEGGYVEKEGRINAGGCLFAGDTDANKSVFGFISFDISSLAGATIQSASAVFSLSQQWGDPIAAFDNLALNDYYWGTRAIQLGDAGASGNLLQMFGASTFSCSNAALKTALQNAINAGRPRFQLRIHFTGPVTDSDGQWDGWEYQQSNVKLSITYIPGA